MIYQETFVQRNRHRIYVREYPGEEPAIILMHGFPDNLHLYDRLFLISRHRVESLPLIFSGGVLRTNPRAILIPLRIKPVTWMPSSLNCGFSKSSLSRTTPLVRLPLTGPLTSSERVAGLVLLNTYYCAMPTLRPPEAIWLFSTPVVRNIARPVSRMFGHWIFRRMYQWQVGRFFRDAEVRNEFLPLLYQQFDATPSARAGLLSLERRLIAHHQIAHKNDPEVERVQTSGPDHFWRRGSVLE